MQWPKIMRTGGAQFYGVVVGVVSLALTTRWLGPEGRGIVAASLTWAGTLSTITYLSLGQVAIHRAAEGPDRRWLPGAVTTLFWVAIAMTAGGWLFAMGLFAFAPEIFGGLAPIHLALGLLMLPFLIGEQYGTSVLSALDRLSVYNQLQVVGRTLSLVVLVLLVVALGFGVAGALFAAVVGQAVIATGGFANVRRRAGGVGRPELPVIRDYLRSGLQLHPAALGVMLFSRADLLILTYFRGAEETGYYQLGSQLIGILLLLPTAACMVLYGRVGEEGPDAAWPAHRRILIQITALIAAGALLLGATAEHWLVALAGEAFTPAIEILRWQLVAAVGLAVGTMMGPQWIGRGFFWHASALTLLAGGTSMALNFVWIPQHGMLGAAWSYVAASGVMTVGNLLLVVRCQRGSAEVARGANG